MATSIFPAVTVAAPQCLDDFALLAISRQKLESILDQTLQFPGNGVCGLILHGLYGTGKTTLAQLLPGLIETTRTDPQAITIPIGQLRDTQTPLSNFHPCVQGQNGVSLINQIQNATSFVSWNASNLHYVLLDEFNLLTEAAQANFKSLMNRINQVFIMTTNHLDKIDRGVQNRSVMVDMNAPPADQWRPILKRIYREANLTPPPDDVLDQVVRAGRGSARSIFSDVVLGANQARRDGFSMVSKLINIRS